MPQKPIEQVVKDVTGEWMALPGVVGTGIGELEGQLCIKVFVAEKTDELTAKIPATVKGHRVILQETGQFYAL